MMENFKTLISDPKHKLVKTYFVQIEGVPNDEALNKLRKGILLKDGLTKPAEAKLIDAPKIWEKNSTNKRTEKYSNKLD